MRDFEQLSGHRYAPGYEPTMLERMVDQLMQLDGDFIFNTAILAVCLVLAARSTVNILRHNRSYKKNLERELSKAARDEARRDALKQLREQRSQNSPAMPT